MRSNFFSISNLLSNDTHAFFHRFFISNSNLTNSPNTSLHKFWIHLTNILSQFFQYRFIVFVVNDSDENLSVSKVKVHFLDFYVVRIWKFTEKAFYFIFKNLWMLFNYVLNIFQYYILNFNWWERHNRNDGGSQFFCQVFYQFWTAEKIKVSNNSFDASKNNRGVYVRKSRQYSVNDPEIYIFIFYIYAYSSFWGVYLHKKSRIKTCAHSIHSLMATNILPSRTESILICERPLNLKKYCTIEHQFLQVKRLHWQGLKRWALWLQGFLRWWLDC